jgi:formylglycine-generating enzyme required for sulfatase activity
MRILIAAFFIASAAQAQVRDCPTCPEMVTVPAGSFMMGSPDDEAGRETNEGPVRRVNIAKPFMLGRYEVTVGEFAAFVAETGYKASDACPQWNAARTKTEPAQGFNWRNHPFSKSDRHPVLCVSRADTNAYVKWLVAKTGKPYRLPSEAEWEYAARAKYGSDDLCKRANVADAAMKAEAPNWPSVTAACNDAVGFSTAPVGSYAPNAFGLFDMQGNVWEFTEDCYQESYAGAPADGSAVITPDCPRRTVRGGGWLNGPGETTGDGEHRPANRGRNSPGLHFDSMGFRVALTPP